MHTLVFGNNYGRLISSLVARDGEESWASLPYREFALVNPEVHGDCDERHEGLDYLVWDLTEDGDADKIDRNEIKAAALNLITRLGEIPTPELMMVAIRWIQDEIDPYVELAECEYPRLHMLIAEEENQTAKQIRTAYQIFRKKIHKVGFDLPESLQEHIITE